MSPQNKKIILLTVSILFLFSPFVIFAQDGAFVPLTNGGVPGISAGSSFSDFLNAAFKIGLAVAATLAVVMIVIGGFEYMGRESIFAKTEGRERIQNAVIGLLIALLIWLILYTINPNLLNFNINIAGTKTDQSAAPPPRTQTTETKGGKAIENTGGAGNKTFEGTDIPDLGLPL